MTKNKKRWLFSSFFFLLTILLFPAEALAGEKPPVTREQTFTSKSDNEKAWQKEIHFEKYIKEQGKSYKLDKVEFQIMKQTLLDKKEKMVESQAIGEASSYSPKPEIQEGKITYKLTRTEKEEKALAPAYVQDVTAYDDYDHAVAAGDVPQTKTVTAQNASTGEQESVTCSLTGVAQAGTATYANQITIICQDYDAAYYEWEGNLIPHDDQTPALSGYEDQLLKSAGAGPGSRVTGIAWSGEPYRDDKGVLCRQAVATVQQVAPVYRANYVGGIRIEGQKGIVYKSYYQGADPEGAREYEVKATAGYLPEEKSPLPYVAAGAGILLILAGIVTILIILSKKKEKRGNETWNN